MNDEERIEKLLKRAGKRPEPPADVAAEVKSATKEAWLQAVAEQKQSRWRQRFSYLAAAVVILGVLVVFQGVIRFPHTDKPQAIASFSHVEGQYKVNESARPVAQGLNEGDIISTQANSLISVTMPDKTRLVLGAHSALKIVSKKTVELMSGRMYLDSPDPLSSLQVLTSWGSLYDIGTQYEVRLKSGALYIAMREGEVSFDMDGKQYRAVAKDGVGDVLEVNKDLELSRSSLLSTDDTWRWVAEAEQDLELDGLSVYQLIHWAGRVTGKQVVYDSPTTEDIAKETRLSGSQVDPGAIEHSLPSILRTTTLQASVSKQTIRVQLADEI